MESIAVSARLAAQSLAGIPVEAKNRALQLFKEELSKHREAIERANAEDKADAAAAVQDGQMSSALLKRLDLTGAKFDSCLQGIDDVIRLDDPVGKCQMATQVSEGLNLYRVSCPIGVLAIIFEARPEAAVQIAALAVKSGNAVILKGGKEAAHSNRAIFHALHAALLRAETEHGVPAAAVQLVDTREEVADLLRMDKHVDLVIPRGSNALVKYIKEHTKIPVLGHADGICSVYVDEDADLDLAAKVVSDSKLNYPAACNAMETLLVHTKIVSTFLPKLAEVLKASNVEYQADAVCLPHLPAEHARPSTEEDYRFEFLDAKMAVKAVDSLQEAVAHINSHGSGHTDCIVTSSHEKAELFMTRVDSAGVYHNCSTRFADGFRYGFGAEVGISTNRIHSRGPVGLDGLVIYKYRMYGNGHVVGEMGKSRQFSHAPIPSRPADVQAIHRLEAAGLAKSQGFGSYHTLGQ